MNTILTLGGITILPLLAFSMIAVVLIGERLLFWWRVHQQQRRLMMTVLAAYREDPQGAIAYLKTKPNLPIARIFLAALILPEPTPAEFSLALETAAQGELPILKRFNTVFETIITASPLLGLLGTILGLMRTFVNLNLGAQTLFQTAGVTRGIAEALISTAAGLIIAIITLLFANLFRGLARRQMILIQTAGGQLELLYRRNYRIIAPAHEKQEGDRPA
ncbi:MotA/TolQ/ExbB proton channel family protein [Spirulina sp. CCNP1310]|uniref:MotA/TolQ/ExbB proton channel family protein n=1 Tax=Spirulina sp. CCNP1310 TaxID=3110249 RepID=UPI002B1EB893|nr:MotA/TolQ/ExbB proton channel family protein [Spirulina sp. CCNP1310]MEA5420412.1 MotA/TolQ/ExbB proton channel family protein [Spirulina sp. CCNP1310]